jgi:hypothetical protein
MQEKKLFDSACADSGHFDNEEEADDDFEECVVSEIHSDEKERKNSFSLNEQTWKMCDFTGFYCISTLNSHLQHF